MSSLISIGTSVVAKWPSTSNYYKARVIDYTDDHDYVCQFLDGSIIALPSKYVDLPSRFQRTSKRLSLVHAERMLLDRSSSFQSIVMSLVWISIFIYVQYWFHQHHPDIDRSSSTSYSPLQRYLTIVIQYLCLWFVLQWIFARYFPHMGHEQLIYIKESCPSVYYQHRSNTLWAFLMTSLMMIVFRDRIPLRELTKSYYLLALFSLGITLTLGMILLTNRFFHHPGGILTIE
jgi:hypothetical protein